MRGRDLLGLLACAVATASAGGTAAAPTQGVTTEAKVDRGVVGVGELVTYSLTVKLPTTAATYEHAPGKLAGVELVSVAALPHQSVVQINGVARIQTTITIQYRLRAKTLGKHELGPGKLTVDGKAYSMAKVGLEVVPAGKAPPAPKKPADVLDDFYFKLNPIDDDDEPAPPPPKDDVPDPLARVDGEGAFDPMFARLSVDELRPVVGQPVTAKLFVYTQRQGRFLQTKGFSAPDFAKVALRFPDDKWRTITLGGRLFQWKLYETSMVFPLRTGKLTIGGGEIEAQVLDAFTVGGPTLLTTKPLTLEVIEPPLAGRPSGYVLGDVAADLELVSDVQPREVKDGHAMIELKLRGIGRLERIRVEPPAVPSVTWTSTSDASKTVTDAFAVRGGRRVVLDARFDKTGEIDLGVVRVPVWDPARKGYHVAQTTLGRVTVVAAAPSASAASAASTWTLPAPRDELGRRPGSPRLADRAWPWLVSIGTPLLVVGLGAALRVGREATERRRRKLARPHPRARAALDELGDGVDDAARALELALEARLGRSTRGMTRRELRAALIEAGDEAFADEVTKLHEAIATARFAKAAPPARAEIRAVAEGLLRRAPGEAP